jgi:hypothetical protein
MISVSLPILSHADEVGGEDGELSRAGDSRKENSKDGQSMLQRSTIAQGSSSKPELLAKCTNPNLKNAPAAVVSLFSAEEVQMVKAIKHPLLATLISGKARQCPADASCILAPFRSKPPFDPPTTHTSPRHTAITEPPQEAGIPVHSRETRACRGRRQLPEPGSHHSNFNNISLA